MNIVFTGTKREDLWYERTCTSCTTRFEFQAKEAQHSASYNNLTIECPICTTVHIVVANNGQPTQPSKVNTNYR